MSNIIYTINGQRFIKKASALLVTPYYRDNNSVRYYLGPDTYDIFAIVGDTISITQEDGNTETVNNEFESLPVIENTTIGKWRFTADCLDMQNIVLRQMFNAKTAYGTSGEVEGVIAMPSDFRTVYCCIQVYFDNNNSRVVMPKVLLSSKLDIVSLKSDAVRGKIQGTPMQTQICVADTTSQMLQFSDGEETTYNPRVPLMFVPQNRDFGVLHHNDNESNLVFVSMYNSGSVVAFYPDSGLIEPNV